MLADLRLSRLTRAAASGDAAAFAALYRRLYPAVYAYVSRRVHEAADAEDLTAKVFMTLVEHLPAYERARGSVRGWVISMARHAVIDHFRTRRPRADPAELEALAADASLEPTYGVDAREQERELGELLKPLPPQTREMLSLRYAEGLRTKDIAAVLGVSEAAVKQRFSRALRDLRSRAAARMKQEGVGYVL